MFEETFRGYIKVFKFAECQILFSPLNKIQNRKFIYG